MKIKHKLVLVMGLVIVGTSALFSIVLYRTQRRALLKGIDANLLTAASFTEKTLPDGYHDRIVDKNSVSDEEYLRIVDRYNRICEERDLQYVWSVLVKKPDEIYFTSGTSTSHTLDVENQDWASFYDRHNDPGAFAEALERGEPTYMSFHNEWGSGRSVLVPKQDVHGRTYMFGASMDTNEVDALLRRTLWRSIGVGALLFCVGVLITVPVANTITRPIVEVTEATKRIAEGDLEQRVHAKGSTELESLSSSISAMSAAIVEKVSELQRKNAELERFTYTASHDLKSPLTTIKGFLGILRHDLEEGNRERVEHDLSRIASATDRMFLFLNDLLELSRIGRMMNPPEAVSLTRIAHQAVEMVGAAIMARNVRVDIHPDLPIVRGDKLRLLQVFQNLIDNATKYTRNREDPRIEVGRRRDADVTVCYVRDNGIGIAPEYHDRVFGLFEKLDPKTEGTGVGLALCKRIVEIHGGAMWIESEGDGSGTTFCFTLPEGADAPLPDAPAPFRAPASPADGEALDRAGTRE